MGTISVFRTDELTPRETEQLSLLLSNKWTGASERDTTGWRRFVRWIQSREIGEAFEITIKRIRHGKFHRKHMALEQAIFDAQERFTQFDPIFRDWLKVGAGFVEWHPGPRGAVVPIPKSIAYDKCEQQDYEKFHDDLIDFLLSPHCQRVLWPHLSVSQRAEMMSATVGSWLDDNWHARSYHRAQQERKAA